MEAVLKGVFYLLEKCRSEDDTSAISLNESFSAKYVTDFLPYRFEKNGECLFTFWTEEEFIKKFNEKVT